MISQPQPLRIRHLYASVCVSLSTERRSSSVSEQTSCDNFSKVAVRGALGMKKLPSDPRVSVLTEADVGSREPARASLACCVVRHDFSNPRDHISGSASPEQNTQATVAQPPARTPLHTAQFSILPSNALKGGCKLARKSEFRNRPRTLNLKDVRGGASEDSEHCQNGYPHSSKGR